MTLAPHKTRRLALTSSQVPRQFERFGVRGAAGTNFYQLLTSNLSFIKKNHAAFRPLINLWRRSSWLTLSVNVFVKRFESAFQLITVMFYYSYGLLTFGTPVLWNETLTLNWLQVGQDSSKLTLLRSKFFFYDQKLNPDTNRVIERLHLSRTEAAFVADLGSHQFNISHLKRLQYFLIGLVPINFNPWVLHFPIPMFTQNFLVPHYVLRVAYAAGINAKGWRFHRSRSHWFNSPLKTLTL